jgi:hypothetical protein
MSVSVPLDIWADSSMMKKVDITASLGVLQMLPRVFRRDLHPNSYEFNSKPIGKTILLGKAKENGQSIKEKEQ